MTFDQDRDAERGAPDRADLVGMAKLEQAS